MNNEELNEELEAQEQEEREEAQEPAPEEDFENNGRAVRKFVESGLFRHIKNF